MSPLKFLVSVVIGTRPEAIKLAPVVLALKKSVHFQVRVILTGQHKEMVEQVMNLFNLKEDINLKLMKQNQSLSYIISKSLEGLNEEFKNNFPDLILVQGDTSTAFAGALAGFNEKICVGHVEAGLRTHNLLDPFPEEANRRLISQISSLHFAPTKKAYKNLKKAGVSGEIHLTGNTVIDSLLIISKKNNDKSYEEFKSLDGKKVILTTIHRRENWGSNLENIANAILEISKNKDIEFLLPLHKNKKVRDPFNRILGDINNIKLVEPLDYDKLIYVMQKSFLILTDSGGIQEEAPSLGKPILVLRDTTEREEAIESGCAKLIGTNKEKITKEVNSLLNNRRKYELMAKASNPFGDGNSSNRIVEICKNFLTK